MRSPLLSKRGPIKQQISAQKSFPAPVLGWNDRDALADMKPAHAIHLENWFPRTTYCEVRGGRADHATGMTGNGKTLAVYNSLTGTNKMFCATASGVYNVSNAGAVGASVAARTDGKHQWVMYGDGTNNYLIMCNGVDKPLYFDNTSWVAVDGASTPALTGVTTTTLVAPFVFKGRLAFIQKNTLSFWYLAAGSAGGALTEFPLDGVCQRGGYLMSAASWTVDAGDGPDDRIAFVTSEGEVLVYAGTNPSSAADWALVGVYYIGKPLGRRCLTRLGGDLLVLCQAGVFPLSQAIQSATIDNRLALTNIIDNAFNQAALSYGSSFGWEAILYPTQNALLVNIPISEDGEHEQYVMNTITKAWCKFTEWDAETFAFFNGELYYAQGTAVHKAWTGTSDDGADIVAYGKTAFNYFSTQGAQKRFNLFRPILVVNGNISFLTDIDVDFKDTDITGVAEYSTTSGAQWDVDNWDQANWASGMEVVREWTSPDEYMGYCAAGKIKTASGTLVIQWMSSDYIFEMGGIFG